MAADYNTDVGKVRLLINDPDEVVFADDEIEAFLDLEDGIVKLAAAQALDVIADDEALTSKVIRTQDLSTDGAKVADSLRKRAAALRAQVAEDTEAADEGHFEIVNVNGSGSPELVSRRTDWPWL